MMTKVPTKTKTKTTTTKEYALHPNDAKHQVLTKYRTSLATYGEIVWKNEDIAVVGYMEGSLGKEIVFRAMHNIKDLIIGTYEEISSLATDLLIKKSEYQAAIEVAEKKWETSVAKAKEKLQKRI